MFQDCPLPLFVTDDPAGAALNSPVVLYSPWLGTAGARKGGANEEPDSSFSRDTVTPAPSGSYYHAGAWERLDQVLCGPLPHGATCTLEVISSPELLDADGRPIRYDPRTGFGVSDHLPIAVSLATTRQGQ